MLLLSCRSHSASTTLLFANALDFSLCMTEIYGLKCVHPFREVVQMLCRLLFAFLCVGYCCASNCIWDATSLWDGFVKDAPKDVLKLVEDQLKTKLVGCVKYIQATNT